MNRICSTWQTLFVVHDKSYLLCKITIRSKTAQYGQDGKLWPRENWKIVTTNERLCFPLTATRRSWQGILMMSRDLHTRNVTPKVSQKVAKRCLWSVWCVMIGCKGDPRGQQLLSWGRGFVCCSRDTAWKVKLFILSSFCQCLFGIHSGFIPGKFIQKKLQKHSAFWWQKHSWYNFVAKKTY